MTLTVNRTFFKGPVTCCEYFNDNYLFIGSGPYLSVIDAKTFEVAEQVLALKYRVIYNILINKNVNLICVYGEKTFNICSFDEKNKKFYNLTIEGMVELDDWIWDIEFLNSKHDYLNIVCAHNQSLIFNLNTKSIETIKFCKQKCMLYSAKILKINNNQHLIASGTIYNQILIWLPSNGEILCSLNGHQGVIFNIGFDFSTGFLYSVSDDRSIIIWKLNIDKQTCSVNGEMYTRFYGHEARVWKCVWFHHESKLYVCSVGEDLKCCLWNIDEKKLLYRFNAIRKGSKNIWSLCVNENNYNLITGWQDGGLRKYELKSYFCSSENTNLNENLFEWSLKYDCKQDFTRTIEIIDKKIICCTNQGRIYLVEFENNDSNMNQRLIYTSTNLQSYNCIAKTIMLQNPYLAIGSGDGKIFLLRNFNNVEIKCVDCINFIENSINIEQQKSKFKIFSLIWSFNKNSLDLYLLASFTFLNGLLQLYKLDETKFELNLIANLHLPESKHRWVTSYALNYNSSSMDYINIFAGDKCGNLNVYRFDRKVDISSRLMPIQTINQLTKQSNSINGIYYKGVDKLICCSKDGFYYLFKFDEDNYLELINKYEINSSIDIIEALMFDSDHYFTSNHSEQSSSFDLEQNLLLALCFYGDRFLIWNFNLNRSLLEIKCGGANRSWTYELRNCGNDYQFKFFYLKNDCLVEFRKKFNSNELVNASDRLKSNHLLQVFHGNNISCCKYLNKNYLLTGSEDTQVIISRLDNNKCDVEDGYNIRSTFMSHVYHLQGHDSVVKCAQFIHLNDNCYLLVTAGGKANIKLWKVMIDNEQITQIMQVCEFKRFTKVKPNQKHKNLTIDLQSNPDIRFMDVDIARCLIDESIIFIYFACSDGFIRIFQYDLNANKLKIIDNFEYNRCLLCIKYIKSSNHILCTSTDGCLITIKLVNQLFDGAKSTIIPAIHQSGINSIDVEFSKQTLNITSVGDDSSVAITSLNFNESTTYKQLFKQDMAHGSSIMAVKFLNDRALITASKDQRLNLWILDNDFKLMTVRVYFLNVADVSSIDTIKLSENSFQITIIGSGIEVLNIKF